MTKKFEVRVRGGFSDRYGMKPESTEMQVTSLDERTRALIFSTISNLHENYVFSTRFTLNKLLDEQDFFRAIYINVYSMAINFGLKLDRDDFFKQIKSTICSDTYDSVLTLVESVIQYYACFIENKYANDGKSSFVFEAINAVFEKEYVGYRFIDSIISPITDETETNTVTEAIEKTSNSVSTHISKAISLLSDRENPDYENSIKESICAVEAMCEIVLGAKGSEATLGAMLKKFEKNGIKIHSALGKAFEILYGYTNDSNGIRHAGDLGGPKSTFEEARFMLVSCCAFINYLTAIRAKV